MTERDPQRDPPPDPDLLADLDAGLLEGEQEYVVRKAAASDRRATEVLAALAATRSDLAALPEPAVPPDLVARWDAALATEARRSHGVARGKPERHHPAARMRQLWARLAAPLGPVDEVGGAKFAPRQGQRLWRNLAVVAAFAALVGGLLWTVYAGHPSVDQVGLVSAARAAIGTTDAGGLTDPARRAACLRTVAPAGADPDAPLLGGRRVTYRGEPGVLLVLGTGERGRFHAVVVDEGCGPAGGRLLGAEIIGR